MPEVRRVRGSTAGTNGQPVAPVPRSGPALWAAAPRDRIVGDLSSLPVVPLDSLTPDPDNARLHPERNMESIKDSLATFGQMEPLVVRAQDRKIAAGNGRWQAMQELGWTVCAVSMSEMTDAEFHAFALADNRTAELAEWDFEVVRRLERLTAEAGGMMVGWSNDDIARLRGEQHLQTAEELWQGMPEFVQEDQTSWKHVIVHFACEEDFADFLRLLGQTASDLTQGDSMWHPKAEIGRFAGKRWASEEDAG